MPLSIPAPLAEGQTTTTTAPLYWCAYGPDSTSKLVMLHGGPGASHEYLLPQMLRLADRHRVLCYDQRGGGRSKQEPAADVSAQQHVEDLAAFVSEMHASPLTLVGYSWGGLLALLYTIEATKRPEIARPSRLVLIDPAPVTRKWREDFEREFNARQQGDAVRALREALAASGLRESDPTAYRQRVFELSVAGYFANPNNAQNLTPFRVTGRVQQSVWASLGDYDLLPLLRGLDVPTLVVHGWSDPIPVDSSIAAARAMRARCVVLEASGHVPYVEQPDALFSAIAQFLDEGEASNDERKRDDDDGSGGGTPRYHG